MNKPSWILSVICETQVRLGLVNTPAEQAFFRAYRGIKNVFRSRKGTTAVVTLAFYFSTPLLRAQTPVSDLGAMNQRAQEFLMKSTQDRLRDLWDNTQSDTRWLTDLVQTYRTIKMAKAQYDSLASFNLMNNIQVVDLLPEMDLEPGTYFGGPDDGVSSANTSNDGTRDTYLSLRFRSRKGGVAATFKNWPKFHPKMNVDPGKLLDQLGNLDFDAVKMTQYYDSTGSPIGAAIQSGNPNEVATRIAAYWHGILKDANDWVTYQERVRQDSENLQAEIAQEEVSFQNRAQDLHDKIDAADSEGRKVLGMAVSTGTPSIWDAHYSPVIEQGRKALENRHAMDERSLQLLTAKLASIKTSNEASQSSITYFVESGRLMAQIEKIRQTDQAAFDQILKDNKVARTDKGEQMANSILGTISFNSTDLQNMKLPPAAEQEIRRRFNSSANDLQVLQAQLNQLQEKTRKLETMDQVGADIADAQTKMFNLANLQTDAALATAADAVRGANYDYQAWVNAENARQRAQDAQATKDMLSRFDAANTLYFSVLQNRTSAPAIFEALTGTYMGFLRAFLGGRSLNSVMKIDTGSIGAVNLKQEYAMYEQCSKGVAL